MVFSYFHYFFLILEYYHLCVKSIQMKYIKWISKGIAYWFIVQNQGKYLTHFIFVKKIKNSHYYIRNARITLQNMVYKTDGNSLPFYISGKLLYLLCGFLAKDWNLLRRPTEGKKGENSVHFLLTHISITKLFFLYLRKEGIGFSLTCNKIYLTGFNNP